MALSKPGRTSGGTTRNPMASYHLTSFPEPPSLSTKSMYLVIERATRPHRLLEEDLADVPPPRRRLDEDGDARRDLGRAPSGVPFHLRESPPWRMAERASSVPGVGSSGSLTK